MGPCVFCRGARACATLFTLGLLACSLTLPARGQEKNREEELRIARLIRDLGSNSFVARDAASQELAQLGSATRQQLAEALRSADPEVRMRAQYLMQKIKTADLWEPSQLELRTGAAKVTGLLAAISDQSGNRLMVGEQYGAFQESSLTLATGKGSFWELLDEVCAKSGNRVRPHYDTRNPGLVVVSGTPTQYPVAYAGPFRAEITGARRVFIEEVDYENLHADVTHTFQFNLQVMWEDRFRLVAYRAQPELEEAVTAQGVKLTATQPASSGWNVASGGARQLAMNLRMNPPATSAARLDRLVLKWGLVAVGDLGTIEVEDFQAIESYRQDDVELTIESVEQKQGSRYEVGLIVSRDRIVPEPQEVIFQEIEVQMLDFEGKPFRSQGQTNSLTGAGAKMKITFTGETTESRPKLIRVLYPRIRSQEDLRIVFRDVPLPVGRPE
ncbi:MAG: hypothetical protein KF708_20315 [Pirellulales bacterium]|nr:hypothetical protein [Pirellulales bacterium]